MSLFYKVTGRESLFPTLKCSLQAEDHFSVVSIFSKCILTDFTGEAYAVLFPNSVETDNCVKFVWINVPKTGITYFSMTIFDFFVP